MRIVIKIHVIYQLDTNLDVYIIRAAVMFLQ